jgi:hypothetical protein
MRTPSKQKLAAAKMATRMRCEIERIERIAREKNFPPGAFRDNVVQALGELTSRERDKLEERITVLEDLARGWRAKKHPKELAAREEEMSMASNKAKPLRENAKRRFAGSGNSTGT